MKTYAMRTFDGNVVFLAMLENADINQEVNKWEQTSNGITVEEILEIDGIPDTREDKEILREELKAENGEDNPQ